MSIIMIHMLKNFPPSCLNRDDSGLPKTCIFGGVERSRISSQCLKRSWRESDAFQSIFRENNARLGIRTRHMPSIVLENLRKNGITDESALRCIAGVLQDINKSAKKAAKNAKKNAEAEEKKEDDGKEIITEGILFYAPEDIDAITKSLLYILDGASDLKAVKKALTDGSPDGTLSLLLHKGIRDADGNPLVLDDEHRPVSFDVALFGRMMTGQGLRSVDSAIQVSHAISTNANETESDFFTAVDDLGSRQMEKTATLGSVEFNSSCYYSTVVIDIDQLKRNLVNLPASVDQNQLILSGIHALLQAVAFANPSGKQNTFAAHSFPSAVYIETSSKNIPVSYANAFASPIGKSTRNPDYIQESEKALADEIQTIRTSFPDFVGEKSYWFCTSDAFDEKFPTSYHVYPDMVQQVLQDIQEGL